MPDVKTTKEILQLCYYAYIPVYLWGATASAKTSLVKQFAKEVLKVPVVSLFFQTQEPGDILGLPHVEIMHPDGAEENMGPIKVTSWAAPEWFQYIMENPDKGIIFGDEANRAQPDTAQTFTCMVTERRFHVHQIPPGWRFVFASNYGSEYDVRELDVAIMARFCHLTVSPTPTEWLTWGKGEKATRFGPIHQKVHDLIKASPSHLVQGDAAKTAGWTPKPNRRAWEYVSNLLHAYHTYSHKLNPKTKQAVFNVAVQGIIGKGAPQLLREEPGYLEISAILKNPEKFDVKDIDRFSRELVPTLAKTRMTKKLYANLKEILLVRAKDRRDATFSIARAVCKAKDSQKWADKLREDEEVKNFYESIRTDASNI